jgi:hypothetical protein
MINEGREPQNNNQEGAKPLFEKEFTEYVTQLPEGDLKKALSEIQDLASAEKAADLFKKALLSGEVPIEKSRTPKEMYSVEVILKQLVSQYKGPQEQEGTATT